MDVEGVATWSQQAQDNAAEKRSGRAEAATFEQKVSCCLLDVAGVAESIRVDADLDQKSLKRQAVRESAADHVDLCAR